MQGEDEHERPPLLGLFQIDVVAYKIMSFLNLEDMKALSETSKEALQQVRSSQGFLKNARLDISKESILQSTCLLMPFKWKHLYLDFSKQIPLDHFGVGGIFRSAESLHAYLPTEDAQSNEEDAKERKIISDYLGQILKKMGNLKSLTADEKIIYSIEQDLWNDNEFREVLGRLNSIYVYPHTYPWNWFVSQVVKQSSDLPQNIRKLCSVASQLKRLTFTAYGNLGQSWFDWIPDPGSLKYLEHLELQIQIRWQNLDKPVLLQLECPNLKSFKLYISDHDNCHLTGMEAILTSFFSQKPQLPLEELCISVAESEISNHIKLIPLLTTTLPDDMASEIKKLHLNNEGMATLHEPWEWAFLEKMPQLRDVSIQNSDFYIQLKRGEKVGYAEDILRALPPQIQKLSLGGFGEFFWRDHIEGRDPFRELLGRFEYLRELHLLRNAGTVHDTGLQSIIQHCPKLQALSFSGDQLTAYGMTGVNPETGKKAGVSLDQLTGLVHLKIGRCPNVNLDGLLPVVKFRLLRSFDYEGSILDTTSFFCQLAKQTASLKNVVLRSQQHYFASDRDEHLEALRTEVRKINPRLRSVQFGEPSEVQFCYRDCRGEPSSDEDEDEPEYLVYWNTGA